MNRSTILTLIDGTALPSFIEYKVTRAKLWRESGRNLSGDMRAVLVGIYPKLELTIGVLNESQMQKCINLLDRGFFSCQYYDAKTCTMKTAQYYASDYTIELLDKKKGLYKPFDVSLVPISKAVY